MKFGSVKFFKTLILCLVAVLIIAPTVSSVVLGRLYSREKQRADSLENATLAEMAALLNQSQGVRDGAPALSLNDAGSQVFSASFPYQEDYTHLYATRPLMQVAEDKVCYLTFDDGPSEVTKRVLATLEKEDIKATFFVTGKSSEVSEDALRAASDAGHTIGVHSYSHDYKDIYSSVDAYLADFDKMYMRVIEVTGKAPDLFRFPGGSINVYNGQVYTPLIAEMTRRGFTFYDWNVSAEDAVKGGISTRQITNNVLNGAAGQDRLIVLMHDRSDCGNTAAALPEIIKGLRKQGFTFKALNSTVQPVTYTYSTGS